MAKAKKVVLAYSGGLDTSIILRWLQETYGCQVVTFTADIGQGEELAPAKKKAEQMGAAKIYVEDLRETFVKDYGFPMLRGNAMYEGCYLLGTSIARPLIEGQRNETIVRDGTAARLFPDVHPLGFEEALDRAEREGLVVASGLCSRFDAPTAATIERVREGAVGRVRSIALHHDGHLPWGVCICHVLLLPCLDRQCQRLRPVLQYHEGLLWDRNLQIGRAHV